MKKQKSDNTQYDKKIFRIWTILNKLDAGKHVFTSKLADEFNISVRSIQRDVELLNLVGFPIVPCGKGCYSFVEGFSLGRMMLTEEDATLIAFFYDVSKSLGSKFENSFKTFLKKVLTNNQSSPYYLKVCDGIKLKEEYPFADIISEGINNNSYVKVNYVSGKGNGEAKDYEVQPLKMIFYEGFWYLLAKSEDKDILRKLRFDRMKSVEPMDKYFKTPENLKLILDESTNVWFEGERNKKVTLEISCEVAEFFKKRNYFPKQKIVKERSNGNLVMESFISDDMEIIPTVLSWIPWVDVVTPKEIKEKLHKRIKAYLNK